ncbi:MAG: HlyD family secretion protein [Hyphomonadaceae bacterium]|nr:HlyD family secretion protein [Hyphomonadaceae bacterium]
MGRPTSTASASSTEESDDRKQNFSPAAAKPAALPPRHDRIPEQGPAPADPAAHRQGLDVAERMARLREAFEGPARPDSDTADRKRWPDHVQDYASALRRQVATHRSKLLKVGIGALLLIAVGWMPVRTLLQTTSTEAVINARLITLRAPIEGEIGAGVSATAVGTQLEPGATVLKVVNRRADRGRLDDLRRLINRLDSERAALVARRDDLEKMHKDLTEQTNAFKDGRLRQLEARAAELTSEIAAAAATRQEAERALARATPLATSQTISSATFEKAKRDMAVAAETHAALRHRLAGVEVEAASLRKGVFIGDSYNDRPRSSQRADEVAQRLSEVSADLRERETQLASLRAELTDEARRYAETAAADLAAPVRGSVWEILTAPGETVVRGQELVRLLDCSGLVVTATVGETAYNRLRIGDAARFRLRGESRDHQGRIIGLTGVAAAPANLAIQPSALAKEPYRVTVALPELATPGQCDVGRTGRVTFER